MNFRTLLTALFLTGAMHLAQAGTDGDRSIYVSVPDQRLILTENGKAVAKYAISTSRFGLGDSWSSYRTPLGSMEVAQKIGANALPGAVFHHRQPTGEILKPNAGGRDPIVTRIIWLSGMEQSNRNAYQRGIYIHGTPVEKLLGRPASYGCIRMRSQDVIALFNTVSVGTHVTVMNQSIRQIAAAPSKKVEKTTVAPKSGPAKIAAAPLKTRDHRVASL